MVRQPRRLGDQHGGGGGQPILVYSETGSATLTGALAALQVLPYLLFDPVAGGLADRLRRKWLRIGSDIVAALARLAVPATYAAGLLSVSTALAAVFVAWLAFVWFDAAAWGSLVRVVARPRLVETNSLVWLVGIAVAIAVPALAGVAGRVSATAMTAFAPALIALALSDDFGWALATWLI